MNICEGLYQALKHRAAQIKVETVSMPRWR